MRYELRATTSMLRSTRYDLHATYYALRITRYKPRLQYFVATYKGSKFGLYGNILEHDSFLRARYITLLNKKIHDILCPLRLA